MKIIKKVFCKKNIKWFALLLICFIVIIFFSFRRNVDELKIENHDMYQYLTGIKIEYQGSIKINKNTNNITKISFQDVRVDLDSTPLYYQDAVKAIFPKDMSIIYPLQGLQYKLNYFSTIYQDAKDVYVQDGKVNKAVNNTIIYDGNNLYFLPCACTISFGEYSYDLPAMSYLIVDTLNSLVQLYNREKDEFLSFENITDEVIISSGKFQINATLDLMYYNNKSRLLLKTIDKLSHLES